MNVIMVESVILMFVCMTYQVVMLSARGPGYDWLPQLVERWSGRQAWGHQTLPSPPCQVSGGHNTFSGELFNTVLSGPALLTDGWVWDKEISTFCNSFQWTFAFWSNWNVAISRLISEVARRLTWWAGHGREGRDDMLLWCHHKQSV